MAFRPSRSSSGPRRLSGAISDLIALRGLARPQGDAQLQQAWREAAGEKFGRLTRAVAVRRGVLHVGVASAPLLSELVGYYRRELLERLQARHAHLNIRDLKFRLDSAAAG